METQEENAPNIVEQNTIQEEALEPAHENIFKRIGRRVIGIVLFVVVASVLAYIIITLRVGSTH